MDADTVSLAEAHLVERAAEFGPRELGRIGRRVLEIVAADVADKAEAARLADLEASADQQTRLSLRRLGNGTTRLSGRLPDATATRLATYLEAYSNPRAASSDPDTEVFTRLPYPRRMGKAFVQLLETLDAARLPIHDGDAMTIVITIPLDSPRTELAAADLIGSGLGLVPCDELSGDGIRAGEARRLACTAKPLPVVLGGNILPIDLGRARRLFTPSQRQALPVRDRTFRAEGCDIPGTWCEAHHLDPWHSGGRTDFANGVLLCSHHHHRAHESVKSRRRVVARRLLPLAETAATHGCCPTAGDHPSGSSRTALIEQVPPTPAQRAMGHRHHPPSSCRLRMRIF